LAFSVAAHLEPEVLLVDEVLAVGDAAFQKKCLSKMREIASSGCTVLLVSHNMDAVANLCSRAIWIDRGRVRADGPVRQVVNSYMLHAVEETNTVPLDQRRDRSGYGQIRFTGFSLEDINGNSMTAVRTGDPVNLVAAYTVHGEPVQDARVWFDIRDSLDGRRLMRFYSMAVGADFTLLPPDGTVICRVPQFPLLPGAYSVDIHSRVNFKIKADIIYNAASIKVNAGDQPDSTPLFEESGLFVCDYTWSVHPSLTEQA
jgi:lipopolysaccharide transport system ATP-binding protein